MAVVYGGGEMAPVSVTTGLSVAKPQLAAPAIDRLVETALYQNGLGQERRAAQGIASAVARKLRMRFRLQGTHCSADRRSCAAASQPSADTEEHEHRHEHHDNDHHASGHADFRATHSLQCQQPDKLSGVSLQLPDMFGGPDRAQMPRTHTSQSIAPNVRR